MSVSSLSSPQSDPTGTATFLFTDIEGSTRCWENSPEAMRLALARHDVLLRATIEKNGGSVFKTVGDAFCAAFDEPRQALAAALEAQRALQAEAWEEVPELRVRMALHAGKAEERDGDYFGPPLNRVARLLSAGHGGQVLLSSAARELLRDALPTGVGLREMGTHRLKDLTLPERIFQLVAPDLPGVFPALKTLDDRPNNLPVQPTALVGRERELAAIREKLLRDHVRLLTLTGAGGIGKTRLSLQVAAELLDDFDDGVFFVNLSAVYDPALVIPAVGQTLGLREVGGQPLSETLREYLCDKRMLLVLDNFEQVLDGARAVAELLKGAPRVKMLVTSRAALHLSLEHEHHVPPLSVPNLERLPPLEIVSENEAVRLFVARARAVRPDFELDPANAPAVAEICARVDGLPLAIELAAARIKILTPQAMIARLGSRLKLLTGGARDLPSRQQTLRGTIEWSHELLHEEEKRLFRRLAVFVGGRTLEAVEAICSAEGDLDLDVLDGLGSLVDKSLAYQVEGIGGEPRFLLLETIQEYALERLEESGEARAVRQRHAGFFLRLAEEAEPRLIGRQQALWLQRLEEEHGNLSAALEYSREASDGEFMLRLVSALWRFWLMRGHLSQGGKWMETALRRRGGLSDAPTAPIRTKALRGAGALAWSQGEYASARSLLEESLALARELGDRSCMAASLNNLGSVALHQGYFSEARSYYEESLSLRKELADQWGIAESLNNLAIIAHEHGDYSAARTLTEESLVLLRELGEKQRAAFALNNLGDMAVFQGDFEAAHSFYGEGLGILRELGDTVSSIYCIEGLARAMAGLGRPERAIALLAAAEALREAAGAPLPPSDRPRHEQALTRAHALLGEEVRAAAVIAGRAMTIEQAIAYALGEDDAPVIFPANLRVYGDIGVPTGEGSPGGDRSRGTGHRSRDGGDRQGGRRGRWTREDDSGSVAPAPGMAASAGGSAAQDRPSHPGTGMEIQRAEDSVRVPPGGMRADE